MMCGCSGELIPWMKGPHGLMRTCPMMCGCSGELTVDEGSTWADG